MGRAHIIIAQKLYDQAAAGLETILTETCTGPHRYVQHRDRNPAWCKACRRTAHGDRIDP